MVGEEEVEGTEETEPTEEAPLTPEVESLLAKARKEGKEEAEETYKGIQRTLARKDDEIKELKERANRPQATGNLNELMLQALKSQQSDFSEPNPVIAQMEKALEQEKQRVAYQEQIRRQEQIVSQKRDEFERKITEVNPNLDHDDESLDVFWDAFDYARDVSGTAGFAKAEKRLNRILQKVTKKSEPNPDKSEEQEREELEKAGKLKTETGIPSASGLSFQDFEERYNKGLVPLAQYEERARREGKL